MKNELTKTEYKALKNFLYPHIDLPKVNYSPELIAENNKIGLPEAIEIVESLLQLGLIVKDEFQENSNYYSITPRGSLHLKDQKEVLREKIVWSIIIPTAVAIITSLIFNYIRKI